MTGQTKADIFAGTIFGLGLAVVILRISEWLS